ncbi:uncharacterized protein IWZ02DRAFT_494475 [Phyllosticta citriasiana]|uniref:uncharacterized protein n=1 Tax=Phyllosticta citriasiana TaxID=595635 RepID=UPI0030FDB123
MNCRLRDGAWERIQRRGVPWLDGVGCARALERRSRRNDFWRGLRLACQFCRHLFQHHFHERGLSVPECLDSESNLYTYHFTTAPAEDRDEGAYHGAELWYTFNNIPYAEHSNFIWTAHNYEVERAMSQYWANGI